MKIYVVFCEEENEICRYDVSDIVYREDISKLIYKVVRDDEKRDEVI